MSTPRTDASEPLLARDFDEFYKADQPKVTRFLCQVGASSAEAEDAAAAFEQLFLKWKTVNRPPAWVRKVALRIFLRASAGEKRRRDCERDLFEQLAPSTIGEPPAS